MQGSCYIYIQHGSEVTDHHIFAKLTKHWEEEYHKDMAALNVSTMINDRIIISMIRCMLHFLGRYCHQMFSHESAVTLRKL